MKKIIVLSLFAGSLFATSAFGQGYLQLQLANSTVYDGFTTAGVSTRSSNVDAALFWAPASTASPVAGLLASTPTAGNSTTTESYTVAQAWADILNGTFTLALNASTGNSQVIQTTTTRGAVNYLAGSSFGLNGTTPGETITVMLVSWNALYATPTAAQTAGSAIGWSAPLQFTLGLSPTDINNTSPGIGAFGTFIPNVVVTPEPGTLALAALGGAAMLFIRRKK
jgi:hypothetical protein